MPDAIASLAASTKDRFLVFAFAAADLLVETGADGTIAFATGAFNARLGSPPESFVGQHLGRVFAPEDRVALDLAISLAGLTGRLSPVILRLNDPQSTPVALSALAVPHAPERLCFTLGRLPSLPAPAPAASPERFSQMVQERMRRPGAGGLGLLELSSWDSIRSTMSGEAQRALHGEITGLLHRLAGPGGIAGQLADGRFGVLSEDAPDLRALAAEMEKVLQAHTAPSLARVARTGIDLERFQLTGAQAARALRFALTRFASGGVAASEAAGFRTGLADFVAGAEIRAHSIRCIIGENRLRLAFQPIVALNGRGVHHFEALLRPVFTPGTAIQTTPEFVTFAEAVGMSEELDWAVVQLALAASGQAPAGTGIAVNISGLSIQSPAFRDQLLDLLQRRRGHGELLVELTETADIDDVPNAAATIGALREAGIPVCIDDFGAGSAAFRYLREFKVDFVKLDGAYVRGAMASAREHGFLMSMVELANYVGARVVAEMIETEEQAKVMSDAGIEFGQGWLFGRPGALPSSRARSAA